MARYVALLRAVNVGGRIVRMERLRAIFETMRFGNVATLITSGNVLFDARKAPEELERAIERRLQNDLGYTVATFVRSIDEMKAIAAREPFVRKPGDSLHVVFLKSRPPAAAVRTLLASATGADSFHISDREAYWLIQGGFRDSGFTGAKLEKLLGPGTARNINTVRKLAAQP